VNLLRRVSREAVKARRKMRLGVCEFVEEGVTRRREGAKKDEVGGM